MCLLELAILIVNLNGSFFCMLSCDSMDFLGPKLHQKRWLKNVHTNNFGGKLLGNNHILCIPTTNNYKLLIDLDPTRLYTWRVMTQNFTLNVYCVYYALVCVNSNTTTLGLYEGFTSCCWAPFNVYFLFFL